MWLGMKAAVTKITENSIRPTVMWRMKAGGDQTCDPAMRAVLRKAPDDQRQTDQRVKRKQRAIAADAEPRDHALAVVAERHEDVRAEKDRQTENEDCETHGLHAHTSLCLPRDAAVEDSARQCKRAGERLRVAGNGAMLKRIALEGSCCCSPPWRQVWRRA